MRAALRPLLVAAAAVLGVLVFAEPARADILGDLAESFRGALDSGSLGLALGLVFVAGLATALTPCVYPMIAITVSVFGARQAKSRKEGALLASVFVGGIMALFIPLGVISGMTGMAFGSMLASRAVPIVIALLCAAMALSMFGAFNMNLPSSLQTRLSQIGGSGYKGAFAIGFVCGVIAAPCTGPVLAVLLTWIATTQNAWFGALAMAVYALGLGLLFWVVATFAVSLPKTGKWVEGVKAVFGIVMMTLALSFLQDGLSFAGPAERSWIWLAVSGVAVFGGLALGAVHLSFSEGGAVAKVRKAAGILLATSGLVAIGLWMDALPPGSRITWLEDYGAARALANERGRPLLVDFGAEWCGACQEIEHEVLSDPRVVAEARRFVPVRVDLSAGQATEEKWGLLRDYQQPGLPLVVLHHTSGEEAHRITGLLEPEQFLELMRGVD